MMALECGFRLELWSSATARKSPFDRILWRGTRVKFEKGMQQQLRARTSRP